MTNPTNNIPSYTQQFVRNDVNSKDWFFFFVGLHIGLPPEQEVPVTVGASPFSYQNSIKGTVIVSGGTVSAIDFSRDGTTFYATGQTSGMFTINAQDTLRITYTVLPTVTFVPT